jgi:hypothetical protein
MATTATTPKIIVGYEKHFYAIDGKIHHGSFKSFKTEVKNAINKTVPKPLSQKEKKAQGLLVKTVIGKGKLVNVKL